MFKAWPVSSGTALNRSATRPISATWKIGASSSLLMGDDGLGVLHASKMLDRTRNADRDIDFGRNDLAGLADLIVVGHIARVDRSAAGANGCAELVGEREDGGFEGRPVLQRTATRNDDLGAGQFGAFELDDFRTDKAGGAGIAVVPDTASTCRTAAGGFCLGKGGAANGDHLLGVRRLHGRNRVPGIDRAA